SVREAWKRLIENYLSDNEWLHGLVLLLDARRGVQSADRQLLDYLGEKEIPVLIVLTKIDKLNRSGQARAIGDVREDLDLPADQVLATSARTGQGIDTLRESLLALFESEPEGEL
ncbi:MAG: GTP-binding protein, partial [marine benthic group bacterium]|nr:GTP-binding protein [Gemmatimonadota bacterium]